VGWCLGMWVCTPDRNDLKLGTVAVLDTVSQHTDFHRCKKNVPEKKLKNVKKRKKCDKNIKRTFVNVE